MGYGNRPPWRTRSCSVFECHILRTALNISIIPTRDIWRDAEIVPAWHGTLPQPVSGRMTIFGGTPKGNAESSIDAIGKVLQFLAQSLQTQTAPGHQSTQ